MNKKVVIVFFASLFFVFFSFSNCLSNKKEKDFYFLTEENKKEIENNENKEDSFVKISPDQFFFICNAAYCATFSFFVILDIFVEIIKTFKDDKIDDNVTEDEIKGKIDNYFREKFYFYTALCLFSFLIIRIILIPIICAFHVKSKAESFLKCWMSTFRYKWYFSYWIELVFNFVVIVLITLLYIGVLKVCCEYGKNKLVKNINSNLKELNNIGYKKNNINNINNIKKNNINHINNIKRNNINNINNIDNNTEEDSNEQSS